MGIVLAHEINLRTGSTKLQLTSRQFYALQREMREARREESAKYLSMLNEIDGGSNHYLHTIIG